MRVLQLMLWLLALVASALGALPSLSADTTCSVPEEEWFKAELHEDDLFAWASTWAGPRYLHMVDAFSVSQGIAKKFRVAGYRSTSFDIKLSESHDLVTSSGVYVLLAMCLSLVAGGLCWGAPPCSLFVGASSSVHQRSTFRLLGDETRFCVRLANRIWLNYAVCLRTLIRLKRKLYYAMEQPCQSWGFKLPFMVDLKKAVNMSTTLTWLAFWGADLHKPLHLVSNMQSMELLKRTMTKAKRTQFAERFKKRNARRSKPKTYYKKYVKADGTPAWQGGPDLASSAQYPGPFCRSIVIAWEKQFKADSHIKPEAA